MKIKLTENQIEFVSVFKRYLEQASGNEKYQIIYLNKHNLRNLESPLTDSALNIYGNLNNLDGYYLVRIYPKFSTIMSGKINANTVNSLIQKKVLVKEKDSTGFKYTLDMNLFETPEFGRKKRLEELKKRLENHEYKGIREKNELRREILRIEYALEGKDYEEEMKKEEESRKKRMQEAEEQKKNSDSLAKKLRNNETYNLPKGLENILYNKKFNRQKIKAYRGETLPENPSGKGNGGMALYGRGIYTTTRKAYARKYGAVRNVGIDELPSNPLMFKSQNDFSQFEYLFCKELGIERRSLHLLGEPDEFIPKMGYDGATIGSGNDMIIVKYY